MNSEIPLELLRESRGREIHLQMEDHRTEEFIGKKSRFQVIYSGVFRKNIVLYTSFPGFCWSGSNVG